MITQPVETNSSYAKWDQCNSIVLSWILNSMSRDIGETIFYAKTVKDIRDKLKNRFYQGNGPQVFQLQNELSYLSQDQTSVRVYYRTFKCLQDELMNYNHMPNCTCGT